MPEGLTAAGGVGGGQCLQGITCDEKARRDMKCGADSAYSTDVSI